MAKSLKIQTEQGVFVLRKTREQVLADTTMLAEDKRVYLAMLEIAEAHRDGRPNEGLRDDGPHGSTEAMRTHRNARPKLGKAKRRRGE